VGTLTGLLNWCQNILDKFRWIDFLAPLLLRAYLAPVFWFAANNKWDPFDSETSLDSTIVWFANSDWGLGLPFPTLMAFMVWGAEYLGAICLTLGVAVRLIAIPLMFTMVVAATTVHWDNGWQAVHDVHSPFAAANLDDARERLRKAKSILHKHGNYEYLSAHGSFVKLNNGIEWAATYFVMLLALFFSGAGRNFSVDYWMHRKFRQGL